MFITHPSAEQVPHCSTLVIELIRNNCLLPYSLTDKINFLSKIFPFSYIKLDNVCIYFVSVFWVNRFPVSNTIWCQNKILCVFLWSYKTTNLKFLPSFTIVSCLLCTLHTHSYNTVSKAEMWGIFFADLLLFIVNNTYVSCMLHIIPVYRWNTQID